MAIQSMTVSEVTFRPYASKGLWLPSLVPLSCTIIALVLPDRTNSSALALLALQSAFYCYHLVYLIFQNTKSTPKNLSNGVGLKRSSRLLSKNEERSQKAKEEEREKWRSKIHAREATKLCVESSRSMQIKCVCAITFLLWGFAKSSFLCSVVSSVLLALMQGRVSHWLLTSHASTFSPGEWLMAGQCISLAVSSSIHGLLSSCPLSLPYSTCQMQSFIELSVVLAAGLVLALCTQCSPASPFFSMVTSLTLVGGMGMGGLLCGSLLMGEFVPMWLIQQVFGNGMKRLVLLGWWMAWSVIAWGATYLSTKDWSISMVRKVYHLVAVMVFMVGVVIDPVLLKLASVAATSVCCLLEVFRLKNIPPVGSRIMNAYSKFLDEKDRCGSLILSPIYLVVGLSLPLWLLSIPDPSASFFCYSTSAFAARSQCMASDTECSLRSINDGPAFDEGTAFALRQTCSCRINVNVLALLSGVLSVGIGDTFASIGGLLYGRHKWPGTKKTLEGSLCGVVAQMVAVVALCLVGCLECTPSTAWWTGILITTVLCSLVEAFTDQVDNIALPLLTFCGVMVTDWLTVQ